MGPCALAAVSAAGALAPLPHAAVVVAASRKTVAMAGNVRDFIVVSSGGCLGVTGRDYAVVEGSGLPFGPVGGGDSAAVAAVDSRFRNAPSSPMVLISGAGK